MIEPVLIEAPAEEPITLAEARLHLKIDDGITADDALISALIVAAREKAEHETGRRLVTQTWDMFLDAFPALDGSIKLHTALVKASSVTQLAYLDTAGAQQTVDPADYVLDTHSLPGYLFPAQGLSWPADVADSANAVRVRVVCGYGAAASVPAGIKAWIKLHVGALYRNREGFAEGRSVAELPGRFTDSLLDPYRVRWP